MSMRKETLVILIAGLLLAMGTGFYNIGIIALDDYSNEISGMIPAQSQPTLESWVHEGVHPPLGRYLLAAATRITHFFAIDAATTQLRVVLMLLGAALFWSCAMGTIALTQNLGSVPFFTSLLLISFYFLSPLIYSRPMVESLCLPFLIWSCVHATRYLEKFEFKQLALSLTLLATGCLFRAQIGSCAPVIFLIPLVCRRYKDLAGLAGVGTVLFIITGFVDWFLGKGFHETLRNYAAYNAHAGEWHGTTPFYTFALLFIGLSIPPAFISRYRGFNCGKAYEKLQVVLWFFAAFLIVHSFFPHKEERFMIPAVPLFLILLAPLLAHFYEKRKWIRLGYFVGINTVLLVLVVTQIPQINTIYLVHAVDRNPKITTVTSFEDSLVFFPSAYGNRAKDVSLRAISLEELLHVSQWPCHQPLVVRFDKAEKISQANLPEKFVRKAVFPPAILEQWIVKLNPARNTRRGAMEVWLPERCGDFQP